MIIVFNEYNMRHQRDRFWSISNPRLQCLQSVQKQQAVNRVTRALFVSLTFYRGITVAVAPHPHGNPVRRNPIPTVLPWIWSPLPQFPRGYRSIPAVPITVQTSTNHQMVFGCILHLNWHQIGFGKIFKWEKITKAEDNVKRQQHKTRNSVSVFICQHF